MSFCFVEHNGQRIFFISFAYLREPAVVLEAIDEVWQCVEQLPKRKELKTLVDITRVIYTNDVLTAFRHLIRHNEPWVAASAVYGLTELGKMTFRALNLVTGNRLRGFETRDQALEWLLSQEVS
jgi:hypothetical protein